MQSKKYWISFCSGCTIKQFPLPIRFSIPAVLLLFGSLVGLFSFEREVSLSYLRAEGVEPSGKILWESNIRDVELLRNEEWDGAELVLARSEPTQLDLALLCDETTE